MGDTRNMRGSQMNLGARTRCKTSNLKWGATKRHSKRIFDIIWACEARTMDRMYSVPVCTRFGPFDRNILSGCGCILCVLDLCDISNEHYCMICIPFSRKLKCVPFMNRTLARSVYCNVYGIINVQTICLHIGDTHSSIKRLVARKTCANYISTIERERGRDQIKCL